MAAGSTTIPAAVLGRRSVLLAHRLQYPHHSSLITMSNPRARPFSSTSDSSASFSYCLAASSVPKRSPPRPPKVGENCWNYTSVHKNPKTPYLRSSKRESGEDSFFASTVGGDPHRVAFGVADGVGGWQDQGIDPSDFSQGLCGLMASNAYLHEGSGIKPLELLQKAYDAVIANPRIQAGGSTASLACADGEGNLDVANLGDSGYLVFGPGKVVQRSIAQTHAFNTPYQMSKIPARMKAQHAIFGGSTHFSEVPSQADVTSHRLKHGDVVVFATDGVWDNLSAQDTLGIVTRLMEEGGYWFKSHNFAGAETMLNEKLIQSISTRIGPDGDDTYLPGQLAGAIMREAKLTGLDRRRDGPFAKEVKVRYPLEGWEGGKPDDVAVVVCVAVQGDKIAAERQAEFEPKSKL